MNEHIVSAFENELRGLSQRVAEMGGLVEKQIVGAIDSLIRADVPLAEEVRRADPAIDAMQREIEETGILIIARRQPMAVDLREVVGALRIAADLERVGDLAKSVAKRAIAINGQVSLPKVTGGFDAMARLALERVKRVLDAYAHRDVAAALEVWKADGDIDALYNSLFRELLTYMLEDPRNIGSCTHLLFCAKNLERIGDHATNIAETIHYIVTGTALAEERPKLDTTIFGAGN
ncbi:phosphate signaling complex protein PhoU [Phreatobacter aquaticus]|uniref:Phosphate-specific transport system accessory protein PhoU n=1 Tax=Phreatobacter aquaticus TaxID=2570229 RepID=A0A4D7QCU6_9HYPH|nr:phosphate signaling complex protein PhoU [Phreatobacter aquaticus]QCK84335.1 phosphate signaling complex protein PhoU [Phreatobacter aquaticus]